MSEAPYELSDPQMDAAIAELEALIRQHFPTATFAVSRGDDPAGVYLTATVDIDDSDAVVDVVIDRLLDLQIEQGLPLFVIPVEPAERVAQQLKERSRPLTARKYPPISS